MRSPVGRNSHERVARYNAMTPRIIKHEAVPQCGSSKFALRTAANPSSYWDDLPSRRLRPEILNRNSAGGGQALARAERDKDG